MHGYWEDLKIYHVSWKLGSNSYGLEPNNPYFWLQMYVGGLYKMNYVLFCIRCTIVALLIQSTADVYNLIYCKHSASRELLLYVAMKLQSDNFW